MRLRGTLLLLTLGVSGCAGDGSQLDSGGMMEPPPPQRATLASIQQEVFGAICVNCHVPGGAAEFMILDSEEASFANLVGQASVEIPSLLRVAPGDPDQSYLVWKVEGEGPNGESIVPERMPPPSAGEPALSDEQITHIREWIEDGALP